MTADASKTSVPSKQTLIAENKRLRHELEEARGSSKLITEQYSLLFENLPLGAMEEDYSLIKKEVDRLKSIGVTNLADYFRKNPEILREWAASSKITSVNQALLSIHRTSSLSAFLAAEADIDSWWNDEWVNFFSDEINFLIEMKTYFGAERNDTRIDGSPYVARVIIFVVAGYEDSWKRVVTLQEDITNRKRMDRQRLAHRYELERKVTERTSELKEAKSEAEAASLAKSAFLANMSHEIRTPLNGVLGMAQLLEDTALTDKQQDYLRAISNAGNGLLSLINDVLDFSKLEAEMVEIESIAFDLERLCLESLELVVGNAIDKDLELIFDYQPDCPRHFLGDPSSIRQILVNLLGNAVKFTQEGFIRLAVSFNQIDSGAVQLYLEVEDTGIGLAPGAIDHLFEEFMQADSSTTREYGGTGLGLAITKKLVTLLGGEIGVDSVYGEGTTFWIKCQLPKAEQPESLKTLSLEGVRILLVDNKKENQRIFQSILDHMGANVTVISDSRQILSMLGDAVRTSSPYQILILSQTMQDINGMEVGKKIRDSNQFTDLKLLLFSSIDQKDDIEIFLQAGFNGYLNKNCRYDALYAVLSVLSHHRHGEPLITQYSIEEANNSSEDIVETFEASILLVEDNLLNQTIAKKFLSKMGIKIDIANNGREAINLFYSEAYDLILMDCRMPEMDGYDATRAIRMLEKTSNKPSIPIIALTANTSKNDRILCTQAGMNDVITKPFRRADLANSLRQWLPEKCTLP